MTEWFLDDDAGYLAWLAAHEDGFVLNTYATWLPDTWCCTRRGAGPSTATWRPARRGQRRTERRAQPRSTS